MAYNIERQQRLIKKRKGGKINIKSGTPVLSEMNDGDLEIRSIRGDGLSLCLKHSNQLYTIPFQDSYLSLVKRRKHSFKSTKGEGGISDLEGESLVSKGSGATPIASSKYLRADGDGTCSWQTITTSGTPEGTAILSTGVTDGYVLTANGSDGSAWEAAPGTDNTMSGSYDYITLSGQDIVRGQIDLTADVTGTLPVANGGTNATSLADKAVLITQDSGTDTVAAAEMDANGELLIGGTSGPAVSTLTAGAGIDITNADGAITIDGEYATGTNRGIAKFDTNDFTVTDGSVSFGGAGPITGLGGDVGTSVGPTGGVIALAGVDGIETDVNETANTVEIGAVGTLKTLSDLTGSSSAFIVGTGSSWQEETGATARTSIGLGAADTATFSSMYLDSGDLIIGPASSVGADTYNIRGAHRSAGNDGNDLVVEAGGPLLSGGANDNGGDLLLKGGQGNGTGTSEIQFFVKETGTAAPQQAVKIRKSSATKVNIEFVGGNGGYIGSAATPEALNIASSGKITTSGDLEVGGAMTFTDIDVTGVYEQDGDTIIDADGNQADDLKTRSYLSYGKSPLIIADGTTELETTGNVSNSEGYALPRPGLITGMSVYCANSLSGALPDASATFKVYINRSAQATYEVVLGESGDNSGVVQFNGAGSNPSPLAFVKEDRIGCYVTVADRDGGGIGSIALLIEVLT